MLTHSASPKAGWGRFFVRTETVVDGVWRRGAAAELSVSDSLFVVPIVSLTTSVDGPGGVPLCRRWGEAVGREGTKGRPGSE